MTKERVDEYFRRRNEERVHVLKALKEQGYTVVDGVVTKQEETGMTLGSDRVRVKFNPSDSSMVYQIKQKAAELIDLCEQGRARGSADGEHQRLWSLAQTEIESAAMWAVKAATF